MRCPTCSYEESKVVDSRPSDDGSAIRRRRECLKCGERFTTYERLSETPIVVIKADGSSEPYDRQKLFRGILMACAKRPVNSESINKLIDNIEKELRTSTRTTIRSQDLGELTLQRLACLDEVAYIRFASVYKDFKSIDEFTSELERLH
ncbi:MAG: transcriptional regulator NrdR [Coriobacteriia bacterium]|nr:transcriptional regulator NrdR [Coriobacteriia bacterium]